MSPANNSLPTGNAFRSRLKLATPLEPALTTTWNVCDDGKGGTMPSPLQRAEMRHWPPGLWRSRKRTFPLLSPSPEDRQRPRGWGSNSDNTRGVVWLTPPGPTTETENC